MGRKKPIIVVTGSSKGSKSAWQASRILLAMHGAKGHFVNPDNWDENIAMDGLLLLGGVDINPKLYGAKQHSSIKRIEPQRDAMELSLLKRAKKENLPIMGICRGMQMINLSYGGTLIPNIGDLELEYIHRKNILPIKWVNIIANTKLHKIIDSHKIKVNALHHQAIDRLGDGLVKAAYDKNNIVQAIEHKKAKFVLGVQWHPEYMPYMWHTHRLFKAFVSAAQK